MKKNYFMLAATAALFAACAETDLVNEIAVEETPQAISFETFANKATRAEEETPSYCDNEALQDAGFHVWGYKFKGNDIVWEDDNETTETNEKDCYTVFNGVNVTYTADNRWEYTGTQYWDQTSKYKFFAVSPKVTGETSPYSINKGLISISDVQNGTDYLIVRPDNINPISGEVKDPVELIFSHIMSKISFKLKAGINEQIAVTSLSMWDYENGTASFNQKSSYTGHDEWTISSSSEVLENAPTVVINSKVLLPYNKNAIEQSATTEAVGKSFIMIPQTISYTAANGTTPESGGLKFKISYKIVRGVDDDVTDPARPEDDLDDEIFIDQVATLQLAQTWATNTHTTYTIIVKPDAIEFGEPKCNVWTIGTGNEGNLPL